MNLLSTVTLKVCKNRGKIIENVLPAFYALILLNFKPVRTQGYSLPFYKGKKTYVNHLPLKIIWFSLVGSMKFIFQLNQRRLLTPVCCLNVFCRLIFLSRF